MANYSVPLTQIAEEFNLTPAYKASNYEKIRVTTEDVNRPGLQLTGFFEHFEPARLQVIAALCICLSWSCSRSAMSAMNSLFVGFPFVLDTV